MQTAAKSTSIIDLSDSSLAGLSALVERPVYDRSALTPGIVHIGVGNFHRAHQAWYVHRLMQLGLAQDWAIVGAGVRQYDSQMRARLEAQDWLTTLVELDPAGHSVEVTGAMIDYLPVEPGNAALIAQMADPRIRIVSMTVTEGGYFQRPDGSFDMDAPEIRADAEAPTIPSTAFGALVAAYAARRAAGEAPFTALSCDNLQGNGTILRNCVVGLAELIDPDLAAWIDTNASFPNSMVDCIVPATGDTVIERAKGAGINDQAPVSHEAFRQWVIEDDFCNGRPGWEQVGVTMTDDVHSYEAMKLRILNGGHQLLANVGEVLSVPTIAACMADADIAGFFRKVQQDEIIPHVASVPGMSGHAYLDLIEQRFANPEIHDTTRRVAFDGSSRHAGFLLPTLRDRLAAGGSVEGLALAEALWARMCAGTREDGSEIEANDPYWDSLHNAALAAKDDPMVWINQSEVYDDLATSTAFAQAFTQWLTSLWSKGVRATLSDYAGQT